MIPLLILGLLKEKPASYGYELLADMKANYFHYFVQFTKGSFYYNMQQLEEKNFIERVLTEQPTDEKEKNRYVLTALGEKEFLRLFKHYGQKNDRITFPFYTPMLFVDQVDEKEMRSLLEKQIQQTQEKIHAIGLALDSSQELRPNFIQMLENSKRHHEVNLEWFKEQLKNN